MNHYLSYETQTGALYKGLKMIGFLPNCPAVADYLRNKLHLRSNELVTLFVFVLGIVNMFISFIDYDILGENNPFSYSSCFHW